ncbi:Octopamine receptor [Holothuria leucospilota]|uniref:Octopamine receptor n=1 Tax=Holothuria leucospilota TaxID=206669 RepID=A0A9Q1HJC2_HOLLE|nr:Octopamine receptor [Holothuria leucospilota]
MEDSGEWTTKVTEDEFNVTDSFIKEDTEGCVLGNVLFLWMCLAFVTMTIPLGILGNLMVVTSVYSNKSLRNANNALLVNLASADLTACMLSSPISWTVIVLATINPSLRDIPPQICSLQVHFHLVSSTVQLVTLALIGLERHAAITHPFEKKKKRKRVIAGIIFAWILGLLLGCISAVYLPATPIYILCSCGRYEDSEPLSSANFYILTPLGILCFIVVVYYYFKIYLVVRNHVKDRGTNLGGGITQRNSSRWASFCRFLSVCHCRNCKVNKVAPREVLPVLETQQATHSGGSEGSPPIKTEDTVHSIAPRAGGIAASGQSGNSDESMLKQPSDRSSATTQHEISSCLSSSSHVNEYGEGNADDPPMPNEAAMGQLNESYDVIDDILHDVNFSGESVNNIPKSQSQSGECVPNISRTHCQDKNFETDNNINKNPSMNLLSQKEFEEKVNSRRQEEPGQEDTNAAQIKSVNPVSSETVAKKTQILYVRENTSDNPKDVAGDVTKMAPSDSEKIVQTIDGISSEKRKKSLNVTVNSETGSRHLAVENSNDFVSNKDENVATESQIRDVAADANVVGSVCVFNPKNRERGRRNVEAGTAKRAAYIIVVFSLCWLPLFLSTLLDASPFIDVPLYTMLFFSCTVLFSSAINPIVYTVVNRSFRQEFKKIIRKPAECIT